ncbi:hypothetical protein EA187_09640 [Lujinxingia sediminis]|uniref:Alpha/beta hydrolase fold-3 domain-containing protein n=2 Tax=Lujinxingia sediminis TaxID=2480984 RepID=A0ABY0CT63_9DELT|nr:hypothetical protein EA187_09640 [Lujinxingia sediminis]
MVSWLLVHPCVAGVFKKCSICQVLTFLRCFRRYLRFARLLDSVFGVLHALHHGVAMSRQTPKKRSQHQPTYSWMRRLQEHVVPVGLERTLSEAAIRSAFAGLHTMGLIDVDLGRERFPVKVCRDQRYSDNIHSGAVDIYRPQGARPRAAILYIHGGGFRIGSKDSHWPMPWILARHGYVVFAIDYRLAPEHPYPAALEDARAARVWMHDHRRELSIEGLPWVVAGESSGANVALALGVAHLQPFHERWARSLSEEYPAPTAIIPTCGYLQVSDPQRFERRRDLPAFVTDKLYEASEAYLRTVDPETHPLVDPLVVLETMTSAQRVMPAFFTAVGTADPLLDDTRRLERAAQRLGARTSAHYFKGEFHSFHAFPWRASSRAYWQELLGFLEQVLKRADASRHPDQRSSSRSRRVGSTSTNSKRSPSEFEKATT